MIRFGETNPSRKLKNKRWLARSRRGWSGGVLFVVVFFWLPLLWGNDSLSLQGLGEGVGEKGTVEWGMLSYPRLPNRVD
jgi:hypothetical protein